LCATPNSQPRADPRRVERAPGGERLQPGLGQQIVCGAGHPPREVAVQGRRVLLDQGREGRRVVGGHGQPGVTVTSAGRVVLRFHGISVSDRPTTVSPRTCHLAPLASAPVCGSGPSHCPQRPCGDGSLSWQGLE
jgi:hypothetical protein